MGAKNRAYDLATGDNPTEYRHVTPQVWADSRKEYEQETTFGHDALGLILLS